MLFSGSWCLWVGSVQLVHVRFLEPFSIKQSSRFLENLSTSVSFQAFSRFFPGMKLLELELDSALLNAHWIIGGMILIISSKLFHVFVHRQVLNYKAWCWLIKFRHEKFRICHTSFQIYVRIYEQDLLPTVPANRRGLLSLMKHPLLHIFWKFLLSLACV